MTVKLARKIGMKKKLYLAGINDTIRLAMETKMSGGHDAAQSIGRTYNICDSDKPVHFGQHSREGAPNYYSIGDLRNRCFAIQ
jgi:hypothetical protein